MTTPSNHAIARTAETALIDLLVDTPTVEQLESFPDGPGDATQPPEVAALSAAQNLRNMARAQMTSSSSSCVPYAMVAPYVAALIRWLQSLAMWDVGVHLQLPPVLKPPRDFLAHVIAGNPRLKDYEPCQDCFRKNSIIRNHGDGV